MRSSAPPLFGSGGFAGYVYCCGCFMGLVCMFYGLTKCLVFQCFILHEFVSRGANSAEDLCVAQLFISGGALTCLCMTTIRLLHEHCFTRYLTPRVRVPGIVTRKLTSKRYVSFTRLVLRCWLLFSLNFLPPPLPSHGTRRHSPLFADVIQPFSGLRFE